MIMHRIRMLLSLKYRKAAYEVDNAKKLLGVLRAAGSLTAIRR